MKTLSLFLTIGAMISGGALAPDFARAGEPAVKTDGAIGVWQAHQYAFRFLGFTTTYSCDGLADKLRVLLIFAGARPDVKSQPGACAAGLGRPDQFASATLKFYTLAPADAATPAGERVSAEWRTVALATRSPRELGIGDCELIEQFTTQLLPLFNTRQIDNHTTCVPHQESGSVINLKFDSWAAARTPHPASDAR